MSSSRVIRIYKAEALFLKSSDVPTPIKETLYNRYTVRFYNEKVCAKCEHGPYRHTEEFCQPCGAFTGEVRLSGEYKVGKEKYVKVPMGDRLQVTSYLNGKGFNLKLFDKTPQARKYPMRFIGTLKDYQKDVPAKLKAAKRGVLKAPPRTGKTVMACATICYIGEKALIVAAQKEWLDGFYDTFMGSATTPKMSNLPKHMIGYCKKPSDFDKYAVCLATYQTFISDNGHKILEKIRSMFGTVIIDECFPGPVPVHTEHGAVPIEQVQVGDRVWSYNHDTDTRELKPVVRSMKKSSSKRLMRVTMEDGSVFTCTEDHKLWSESRQTYVEAKTFVVGESLLDV